MEEAYQIYKKFVTSAASSAPLPNIELEFRIRDMTKEMFLAALEKSQIDNDANIEFSINSIENIGNAAKKETKAPSKIRSMIFAAGTSTSPPVKTSDKIVIKTRLYSRFIDGATINISSEKEDVSGNKSISSADFRVKIRASFPIKDIGFRLDLTVVISGGNNFASLLAGIRDKYFIVKKGRTIEDIISDLNQDSVLSSHLSYECELEYVDKSENLTIDRMTSALSHIRNFISTKNRDGNPSLTNDLKDQNNIIPLAHLAALIGHSAGAIDSFKTGRFSFKQLCNNAITLDKRSFRETIWPRLTKDFYLTDKADGVRTLLYLRRNSKNVIKISSFGEEEFNANDEPLSTEEVLLDCEEVGGKFYCFDLIVFSKANISSKTPFTVRVGEISAASDYIGKYLPSKYGIFCKKYTKLTDENLEREIRSVYEAAGRDYEIDGLIFVDAGENNYLSTKNWKWKPWQNSTIDFLAKEVPESIRNTAPFIHVEGFKCYLLFVTISEKDRVDYGLIMPPFYKNMKFDKSGGITPINFQCTYNPYAYIYYHPIKGENIDGKIVELRLKSFIFEKYEIAWEKSKVGGKSIDELKGILDDADNAYSAEDDDLFAPLTNINGDGLEVKAPPIIEWELVKIRDDRAKEKGYFGNYYTIAIATFTNYIAEFSLEQLWNPSSGYFQRTAETIYKAANGYKRFVINNLFKKYLTGGRILLDLAGGRGADLSRYISAGITKVIIADIDKDALQEANMRYLERPKSHKSSSGLNLSTIEVDLRADPEKVVIPTIINAEIPKEHADNIICNFAFHYFCDQVEHISNMVRICKYFLKPGGYFIFTVMNGQKLWKMLSNPAVDSIDFLEKREGVNFMKYQIKRKFKLRESKLERPMIAASGQIIEVKLPFSDQPYEEPLCNIKFVINTFKHAGFKLVEAAAFSTYFENFKSANVDLSAALSDMDLSYIALHDFIVLQKS